MRGRDPLKVSPRSFSLDEYVPSSRNRVCHARTDAERDAIANKRYEVIPIKGHYRVVNNGARRKRSITLFGRA